MNHVIGRAHPVNGDDEVEPGENDENPVMKIAMAAGTTRVVANFVLNGAYIVQPVSSPPVSNTYTPMTPPAM